jgi:hypothetical protein
MPQIDVLGVSLFLRETVEYHQNTIITEHPRKEKDVINLIHVRLRWTDKLQICTYQYHLGQKLMWREKIEGSSVTTHEGLTTLVQAKWHVRVIRISS